MGEGKSKAKYKSIRWCGLDTETIDGRAVLVCWADERGGCAYWVEKRFDFFAVPPGHYVAWNLNYDARAILAYLPRPVLERLAFYGEATHNGIKFIYYPDKYFGWGKKRSWRHVFDAYQFYGCSLDSAAEKVLGERKMPGIDREHMEREIKDRPAEVEAYCIQDARLTWRLWDYLRGQFAALGISTRQPYSAGALSAPYILGKPRRDSAVVNEIARRAYYGGRVECWRLGHFETAENYDLNSAYPWALSYMPDTAGLVVVRGDEIGAVYRAYHLTAYIPDDLPAGPLPVRGLGDAIVYPTGVVTGWYTMPEKALLDELRIKHKIHEVYSWIPESTPEYPFARLRELWHIKETRAELKLAAKLAMNGLSGKLAQQRRKVKPAQPGRGIYGGPVIGWFRCQLADGPYARVIIIATATARVRVRLYQLALRYHDRVVALATDSISFAGQIPVECGKNMGDWSRKWRGELWQVGCGQYQVITEDGQTLVFNRGFRSKQPWLELLAKYHNEKYVRIRVQESMGLAYTLKTGREINKFDWYEKEQHLGDEKRIWPEFRCGDLLDRVICGKPVRADMEVEQ